MTWLEDFCGLQRQPDYSGNRANYGSAAQEQRDMMNRMARPFLAPSSLDETLAYFRKEGLTDEQIRKAITPALFAALKEAK